MRRAVPCPPRPHRFGPFAVVVGAACAACALFGCGAAPSDLYGDPRGGGGDGGPSVVAACSSDATIGVPRNGHPTWEERLALYAADRARAEPGKTGWPDFPSVPPLLWNDQLGQAALAHSVDMRDTPCFQHQSCDGTDPFMRIKSFFTASFSSMGENIAAGVTDPITAIEQSWINEKGAAPGEDGHRRNMFDKGFNLVGFGYADGGHRFKGYWTQDLAASAASPARLAVGSHFAAAGPAGTLTFGAVYYDAGAAAPERVEVLIDGAASRLTLVRGKSAAGAYEGTVAIPATGCHRYHFRAITAGAVSCYPGTGTLGAAATAAIACPDYQAD